jgi:crossover junction endodeoxyribonuclease RuvC
MLILGIDPGFGRTGWGIIEKTGNKIKLVECGVIETHSKFQLPVTSLQKLGANVAKNKMSMEEYFAKSSKSKVKLKLGEVEIPYFLRLLELDHQLSLILKKFPIDNIAIEKLFFFKNQKTVIDVAQARGVIILTCLRNLDGLAHKIFEYTPLQVKQSVTGSGRADKKQVTYMVTQILKSELIEKMDDASDAIAIAITHSMNI